MTGRALVEMMDHGSKIGRVGRSEGDGFGGGGVVEVNLVSMQGNAGIYGVWSWR